RGLLGRHNEVQFRHARGNALKEADVIIVCGFPFGFRLGYGRSINKRAKLIAANLSVAEMRKNRRPEIAVEMHAGEFLCALSGHLADQAPAGRYDAWFETLRGRERARDAEIAAKAAPKG